MRSLTAVLLVTLTTASAHAKLEIRDVQASHGSLGPERKSAEYIAGDQVFFRFTLAGVRTDADGRMRGEVRITVTDSKGEVVTRSEAPSQQALALGGDTVPGVATVSLNLNMPPGVYEVAVVVTDLLARESAEFRRKVTCKPVEFALVRLRFYQDARGEAPARVGGTVRQALFIRMEAVGFDRSRGEIDVELELQVFDAEGKPLMPRPVRASAHNEKPEEVKTVDRVNLSAALPLTRAGDFVLRMTVTDTVAKKKVSFETPLRVTAP